MTKTELIQQMRNYLDEYGTEVLTDTAASASDPLGCAEYLDRAYSDFAKITRSFTESAKASAIAGRGIYGFAAFGIEELNKSSISAVASANNTYPFILIPGEPSGTQVQGHLILIEFENNKLGPQDFTAVNVTIEGTDYYAVPISEVLAFPAATACPPGWFIRRTTHARFATVTSITPSVAQSGGDFEWMHSAGVAAQSAGGRIFEPSFLSYDGRRLTRVLKPYQDKSRPGWRFEGTGTPSRWMRWSGNAVRVMPAPSANLADGLYLEGFSTPDTANWGLNDAPEIHESYQWLLAVRAAALFILRSPTDVNKQRAQPLVDLWAEQTAIARMEIHSEGDGAMILGRWSERPPSGLYELDDDIAVL